MNISGAQKPSIILNGCSLLSRPLWRGRCPHVTFPPMPSDTCRSCAHSYRVLHNKLRTIARKMMLYDAAWAGLRDMLGTVQGSWQFSENHGPSPNSSDCLANYGQFLADITRLSCLNYPKSAWSHPHFVPIQGGKRMPRNCMCTFDCWLAHGLYQWSGG